ncbi:Protein CBG16177 [Caenorhabditis briggsae]|uniref:Protein CBG16177 n=1 Tax=Caenorhabditis briggsae TaxID=6238 RepID=A8XNY4_CAEBR|nr:Protein CBG16177 [Caenorhabditis briggsae]CAP34224.1 Protein CBG16177 [Caenorhabditis briggsae]
MRLFFTIFATLLIVGVFSNHQELVPFPKLLNIQVLRCGNPTIYSNTLEEEERVEIYNPPKVYTEFDETVRLESNETGLIQFFILARGQINVAIWMDEHIVEGVQYEEDRDLREARGFIISLPFKVVQSVRETKITVRFRFGRYNKTTEVYASTNTLEPPRPPTLYLSIIFSESEMEEAKRLEGNGQNVNDAFIEEEVDFGSGGTTKAINISGALKNITNSASTIERIPRRPKVPVCENINLKNLIFNRISFNTTTVYESTTSGFHDITIKKFETGQIIFAVSGPGNLKVSIWSTVEETYAAKTMQVTNGYAAFSYKDGYEHVAVDKLIAYIENDLGEQCWYYLTIKRVE